MALPYHIKGRQSGREWLDLLVPDRKKPDRDLAEKLIRENIPNMLYKYRSFDLEGYSLINFQNDELWLAKPDSFNDPFDSISKEDFSDLTDFYEKINDEKIIDNDMKLKLQALANVFTTRTQFLFHVGCLSGKHDSTLMWSHYADNHKGFCIGYSGIELFENDTISKNIYPVLYSEFGENPYTDSALGLDYSSLHSVLRKNKQWEYEHEWRIVLSFIEMDKPGNIRLPKSKEVYLGVNISDENKTTIMKIAKDKSIPVWQTKLDVITGELEFIRIQS